MVYGYANSTEGRDIERQKRELKELGAEKIYSERVGETLNDHAELNRLFAVLREGDTITVTEAKVFAGAVQSLCEILDMVQNRRLRLKIGKSFDMDCRLEQINPMTKGMIMMWGVFAEMERNTTSGNISDKIRKGMEKAKENGKTLGRPKTVKDDLSDKFWKFLPIYENGSITITEFAMLLNVSRPTLYKYLKMAENTADRDTENRDTASGKKKGKG